MSETQSFPVSPKPETLIEALSIIRQQSYNVKLLTNDNKIKDETIEILKAKIKELEKTIPSYQEQMSIAEESLNDFRQEFQSKIQGEVLQNKKLTEANEKLQEEKKQLQEKLKAAEKEKNISKASFQEIYDEIQELRIRSSRAQQAILDTRDMLYKKQSELAETEKKLNHVVLEKEEISDAHKLLSKENEELTKMIEGKNSEMEEYLRLSEEYKKLKQLYEGELTNSASVKETYEQLKRKYEELERDFGIKELDVKQQESNVKSQATKIEGLQKQVEKLKEINTQKDNEITKMNKEIEKIEQEIKETTKKEEEKLALSIAKAIELIKTQVIEFDHKTEKKSIYNDAMHKLMQSIIEQNRQLVNLKEAQIVEESEYQYLENMITELGREKEEFLRNYGELMQNYEELEKRFQEMEEVSEQEKNELHLKFEKEREKMIGVVNDANVKAQEELATKDDEIYELLEEQRATKEYLLAQEEQMNEIKDKFIMLAEEANQQREKFDRVSFVLAAFLKVFVNLLARFGVVRHQKEYLNRLCHQYFTKLSELKGDKEKSIMQKFKNTVRVIQIALRMRKIENKPSVADTDELEFTQNLQKLPDEWRKFIYKLTQDDIIGEKEDVVNGIREIVRDFEHENENIVLSKIISCLEVVQSPGTFDTSITLPTQTSQNTRREQLQELSYNEEVNSSSKKARKDEIKKERRLDEKVSSDKENEYKKRISELGTQLEKAQDQADIYKKSNDKLVNEFDKLKEEVVELVSWVSKRKGGDEGLKERGETNKSKKEEEIQKQENTKIQEKIMSLHSNLLDMKRNHMKLQKIAKSQEVQEPKLEVDQENLLPPQKSQASLKKTKSAEKKLKDSKKKLTLK